MTTASRYQIAAVARIGDGIVVQTGWTMHSGRNAVGASVVDCAAVILRRWVHVIAIGQENAAEVAR